MTKYMGPRPGITYTRARSEGLFTIQPNCQDFRQPAQYHNRRDTAVNLTSKHGHTAVISTAKQ